MNDFKKCYSGSHTTPMILFCRGYSVHLRQQLLALCLLCCLFHCNTRCWRVKQAKTTCLARISASRRPWESRAVTCAPLPTATCTRFTATICLTCYRCTPSSPSCSSATSSSRTTCATYVRHVFKWRLCTQVHKYLLTLLWPKGRTTW